MTTPSLALAPRRDSSFLPFAAVAAVLAVAAAGWVVLAGRMAGMDAGPGGDPGGLGWFAASWIAMTAAMMLPAAAPAVARLVRSRPREAASASALFLASYAAVWLLAGLAGYAAVVTVRGLHVDALAWSSAGRYLAGGTIAAAGLFQLTGAKRRWLARCASPEAVLHRRGGAGALLGGVEHGLACVACCWALMAALYALGMMSIVWMAVITVLVAVERIAPRPAIAVRAAAIALVVLGLAVAAAPRSVPALKIPAKATPMGMPMSQTG